MRKIAALLLILQVALSPAVAADSDAARQDAVVLVRYTLLALDQANKSGNYAVLRDLGAPSFRSANSPDRLKAIFAGQRKAGLDLARAAVLEPVWTAPATRTADGTLHLAGFFPAGALQTHFQLGFQQDGPGWRLSTIALTLQPAPSAAPAPAQTVSAQTVSANEALELRR